MIEGVSSVVDLVLADLGPRVVIGEHNVNNK